MLWHKRMNHANYHAVKMMPEKSSGMGVDFKGLNIEDLPPCEGCAKAGIDPYARHENSFGKLSEETA
jgi:hypothetical protein